MQSFRVLHAANMRQTAIGVVRQMMEEQRAARELSLPWETRLFCPYGAAPDRFESETSIIVETRSATNWISFKRAYYGWLLQQAHRFDAILLRYSSHDPLQSWFALRCPVPIVTMHHNLAIQELVSYGGAKSKLKAGVEMAAGPLTLYRARGYASHTKGIALAQRDRAFGNNKPVFQYSNGALYSGDDVIDARPPSGPIELLLLSSRFGPWTGLDLLYQAATRSGSEFVVHVAGFVTEEQKAMLSDDSRFVVHGPVDKKAIEELIARSAIGLSTFALFRKGLDRTDSLKAREYLRAGLPVYAGYTDTFPDEFPYFHRGPCEFDSILTYAASMRAEPRHVVSNAARPFIDKQLLVQRLHQELFEAFRRDGAVASRS